MAGAGRLVIVLRLVKLLKMTQRRGPLPPVVHIAKDLGCAKRTIFRDLVAFEEAGIEVRRRRTETWSAS